jgi:dihydropteroate synthase
MEYDEAANFLFDLRRFQVDPGTESIRDLLAFLDDPHEDVQFVQIAGSNGKGSTATMVASILRETDLTVGLYTSPHFDDLTERVRVDGRTIPRSAVAEFVTRAKPFLLERSADGEPLTFFETVTALGLWFFGREAVDFAVLEVGMGGRLDATSVVDPVASAVTNVSLEHTAVLGDTVAEIAQKKAAVAPTDAPLVTAATGEALATLRAEAGDLVTVGFAPDESARSADADGETDESADTPDVTCTYEGRTNHTESAVSLAGPDWALDARLPLLGRYQATNAGCAVALARQLTDVDEATLARGLRNAHWPGRFEVLETDPLVVLDGAHNPSACESVAETLAEFDYADLHLVFGAMHDKDHRAMAEALPAPASVTTCKPNLDRAEDPEVLAEVFDRAGAESVEVGESVADALASARARAEPDDCVLVVGSLFCVAEARRTWTRTDVPTTVRDAEDARGVLRRAQATGDDHADHDRGASADDLQHRVVTTRLDRDPAERVACEFRTLGGTCALSGQTRGGELVEVVLGGTLSEFDALADRLADAPMGLSAVAEEIASQVRETGETTSPVGQSPTPTDRDYPWSEGPCVMGVVNVTPDSFHDGGEFEAVEDAVAQAESMVEAGVGIVDVGGESTRPGADPVPVEEEIDRVVPVIEAIADLDVAVSIDTRKAEVAEAGLEAGATVLNDVTGLADPAMRFLAAEREVPVIVMHSIDAPVDPDRDVTYDDVVTDVIAELRERVLLAEKAGIPRERVVVDPGIGFGKSNAENFELLDRLDEFEALGCPLLVGHSHKSLFELIGRDPDDRLSATVAATALAADRGADVIRVHDVAENVAAVDVARAMRDPESFE